MQNCDWNFILAAVAALGSAVAIYLCIRGGIEKMIQKHTDVLHNDIMGIKEDIKEIREDIKEMRSDFRTATTRIDYLYQMFVDLLKSQQPKSNP